MTRTARALLAAVFAATLLAGCAAGDDRSADSGAKGLAPLDREPGVVHVHGLGVDPGDGTLYAATHSGLFRIPEQGVAERVANRAQDTMGFSVVGPGRFIGSGHPDAREDGVRPPLLGLIESDDAGQSWKRLSLHGKADFHALTAAHGLVYGYDSTSSTFMVTEDKRDWDRRSRLAMLSFAVDPTDADRVVATTRQGPAVSSDGGRTWSPLAGAPPLAVLAWAEGAGLYGAAGDGAVHRSDDGGRTWQRTGSAGGTPEAITVDTAGAGAVRVHVAVAGKGIVVSTDGSQTFTTLYAETGS